MFKDPDGGKGVVAQNAKTPQQKQTLGMIRGSLEHGVQTDLSLGAVAPPDMGGGADQQSVGGIGLVGQQPQGGVEASGFDHRLGLGQDG